MSDEEKKKGEETPPPDDEKKDERTFSQADVDRIIKERLTREQTRTADYDDLKKAAKELAKLKEQDLSEQERLRNEVAALKKEKEDWDTQAEAEKVKTNQRLLRAEVRVAAVDMNFIDSDEAWKLADLTEAGFDDDGKVKGVDKALKALAKAKPHLLKGERGPGSPPNKPGKKPVGKAADDAAMSSAADTFGIRLPKS